MSSQLRSCVKAVFSTGFFVFTLLLSEISVAQSNHTVSFSGSAADFNAAEKISSAAGATDYYITFDASNLYVGAFRTSGVFASTDNLTIYLDTDPNSTPTAGSGTTSGQTYDGVSGTLPFSANYNVHAEQGTQEARSDAGSWASTISGLSYNTGSTWREVTIPFSSIGNPDALYLTMWMGATNSIYANAPGADLGGVANPTVTDFIGGFGVSSVDCIPVNILNLAITASISNAVPAAGITYGKVTVSSGSITATNNFNIAPGGSLNVSGGSLDISGLSISMGGAIGAGNGTTVNYSGGTLTSSATTSLIVNGEGRFVGSPWTYEGSLRINRSFVPLASGGTTLGTSASLDMRSGSSINTNSLTYSNGSTLMYNTGAMHTASLEWLSGAVSGTGIPSHVIIGNSVGNSVLSFGSSSAYRHANGNVEVSNATSSNGLTLSSTSGGDLSLTGDFTQNGTFTHNNRSVTMSGTGAQIISGSLNTSGATNNFRDLVLNNNGGSILLNSSAKITATSGDVLQMLNNAPLNIGSGVTLTLEGNGGAVLVSGGTRTINFNASNSSMAFSGSKTISSASSGTLSYTSSAANGSVVLSAAVNFGNLLTTIGNDTYLELISGGSILTNAPTYASGSTLVYNTGGAITAGAEWSANSTSGSGVPSNVLVGNGNNTTLSFGTSSQFRHANRNVTVSPSSGLTLSTNSGGDLQLRGDFIQNGTFTHNNRLVTFNGTSAQGITGSLNTAGASNNFAYLAISNSSSGVTINSDVLVSQTTGDVLQLLNSGPLNIASSQTLTLAGAGGNIRVNGGSRSINFNASSSIMNITGSKTVASTSSGLLNFTSSAANGNLRLSAAVNFGASLTTIGSNTYLQINAGGSVATNAPTYGAGSTLVYNAGGTVTVGTEWTINSTTAVGVPQNVLIGNGVNTTLSFGAAAQFRHANDGVTVSASSGLTLSSAAGGNLQLRGDFTNSGTFTHNNRDVTFNGTSAQQEITGTSLFYNLILNNSNGLLLNNSITASNVLTLTAGSITLGSNNITLSNTATGAITGTFSASRMIITNGTGQLIRAITTGTNYTFPIGETTGTTEYSPALFNFSANGTARNIGVRVIDADHPQLNTSPTQTDYVSRYWLVSNSAASTYTYTSSFTFVAADLNGSQSNLRANMWNGSAWTHVIGSSAASNTLSITTAATQATVPLGATAEFTGRVNNGQTYTWNVGSASWQTAGSWNPARTTPLANDVLIFNNVNVTASNVPTQTIGQLLINGTSTVVLTPSAANNTLTIAGGNGTDFSIASAATLTLNNGNATTIAFANSTVATIAGVLNLSGSTNNELDCTNSVVTVSGSINSFGTVSGSTSSLIFGSTGVYRHNYTNSEGTIPTATWNASSTCLIQGYTSGGGADFTPGGLSQSFGHFTWNCPSQSSDAQLDADLTSIAGNFTITSANGRDIRLSDASSMTLNIGGNLSLASNGTELRFSQNNGTHTVQVNVVGNYSQTNTTTLNLTNGNGSSAGVLRVGGNFSFSAGTITQTSGGTNAGNLIEFNGSASQAVNIGGTISNEINFRLNNTAGMTLTGTIPILSSCTFYRTAGAITGGTIDYDATGSTLVYEGTTAMTTGVEFPSSNGPEDVTVNSTNTISLSGPRTIRSGGVFTNTSGIFSLGSNDLTLLNSATGALVNASPSASNMIAAGGSGQLKRTIATGGNTYLFPIGDITGTAEYSGVSMNFTGNSISRVLGFRVVDGFNANDSTALLPSIDYTSRTWYTTLSVTTGNYTYTPTLSYNQAGDVYGTENNMLVSNWTGTSWSSRPSLVNDGSPTSTIVTTGTVTQATLSLNGAEIMGRAPIKYWTGNTSNAWATGSNWVPSGAPTASDNIDISFYTNFPCVLSSGTVTVNHLTLSGTGDFTLNSGATLIVAGNFTYDNPASAVFSCGSTLTLNNSVYPQTVPAINYGSLNIAGGTRILASSDTISICNDYTPTAGSLTHTGSTVQFNGTTAQNILTNSTTFNNLYISNTSANVNSGQIVNINGSMLIDQNARLNKTAGTLTISGVASALVNGALRSAATVTPTGNLTFGSTGSYEHNYTTTAGAIPNSTWNAGSTCLIMGYTSNGTAPTGLSQAFHHFTWNCQNQSSNMALNGALTTVNGDLTVIDTDGEELRFTRNANTTTTIGGSFIQSGGEIVLVTGNGSLEFDIAGDYEQTGGYMDFTSSNSGDAILNIAGNYDRTGNGDLTTTGLSDNGLFRFNGTTQSITDNSSGTNQWTDYAISNGSTTTLLTDLDLDGSTGYVSTVTISSGGTLVCGTQVMSGVVGTRVNVTTGGVIKTANTAGLMASAASGTVQTDTRTYSSGATYEYNGSSNQNTGDFWTATSTANTVANLNINNTASTVTMNSGTNVTVTSGLNFSSSNTANLDVVSQTIYVSNAATTAVSRPVAGHVIGNLRRAYNSGTNTYVFHIGTSAGYTPASLAMVASAAGSLTAKSNDGAHPNMATNGMSQTSYVNRYWTLTYNSGNFTSNANSFTYLNSDIVGGATAATLRIKRYSAGWTAPTYTSAANLLTATGLTNTTSYGDFFAAADCSGYVASITPGGATTFCNGDSVSLVASSNITGSTYSWSPATGLSSTTGATVTASPTSSITYVVTATSPQSCVDTDTISVVINARPTGVISGTTSICNGSSTSLSINLTGSGPWSGTLSNGAAFSGSSSPISVSVSPTSTTTYTIATLNDANCVAVGGDLTGSAVITVNSRPTGTISGTTTICNGDSPSLSIVVTGSGPWNGTLSNGASFSGSSSPISVSVSPTSNTTFTISTLSDANCSANGGDLSGSAVVTVNARPTGAIGGSQSICIGDSAPLFINVTGTGTISGTLNPGSIPFSGSAPTIFPTVTPGSNTTYTIATLNDANCSATGGDISGSAVIVVNALPTAAISGSTNVCDGSSSTITFTGTPDAIVTYTKNGGSNLFITLDGSGNATLNSGPVFFNHTYALVSVDNGYCSDIASGTAVLTHNSVPEADISGSVSICAGASTTISFSGDPGATITYKVNAGPDQFITLSGGGTASFNTGALAVTTTYLLVSVSNGVCSQPIGMNAIVTIIGNTYYQDIDGDGFGNPSVSTVACTAPVGYILDGTDCCDSNADINPLTEWWADVDGDGYGGFISANGCLPGVTCSSGTWPAQTIPYYPAVHGGASYVADCNDNNAAIYLCGGVVNDQWANAIQVNVTNPNAIYPNCLIYNGSLVNATISSQGNVGNVAVGGGRDVWYKFVAPSTAVQIKVTPSGFDAVVELQNSSASQVDAENVNTSVNGLEVLNFNSLTVGNTYWVAIRNYHNTNVGSFAVCVSPLMPSGCAYVTPVGGFSLCNNYKALYRGAASYTFRFTGTGGAAAFPYVTTTGTTNGLIPMSNPALDLRYGGIYSVRIDANYNLVNGLGAAEPTITVLGNVSSINCTGVSIIAAPTLEVQLAQRCPATLIRTQFLIGTPISGSPNACTASNYTFEFTPVTDCTGATTLGMPAPFTVNSNGNTPYLMLTAAFPAPLANSGYWRVRIRPNFSYGSGSYGPPQVIQVTSSSASQMLQEPALSDNADRSAEMESIESAIYPNPNTGQALNLNLTGLKKGNVYIRVNDAQGRIVYQDMYATEGSLNTVLSFNQGLRAGMYLVEFINEGKTFTERLIVE
jgi:hypothetical protein